MRFLLFVFLLPFSSFSQSYTPLIDQDSTSVWKDYDEHVHIPNQGWTQTVEAVYTISGDTVLNGQTYAALSSSSRLEAQPIPNMGTGTGYTNYYNNGFEGAIREDGKQIFYWDVFDESEHLIYDFNLGVGDTIPTPCRFYFPPNGKIESIDSVLIDGGYRKRYHIVDFDGYPADMDSIFLIEGIGSTAGFLLSWEFTFQTFEARTWLSCYKEYGSVLYSNTSWTPTGCTTENLSFEELNSSSVSFEISQNPVRTGSTISINYEYNDPIDVKIIDARSQVIKVVRLDKQYTSLEVSFPAGVYFLVPEKGNSVERLVVYR